MSKIIASVKANTLFILLGLISFGLLPWYQYHYFGDTPSYISIANHYYYGRWNEAVNAYWSPLISWLTTSFMYVGFDAITSLKVTCILTGILVLKQIDRLSLSFSDNSPFRTLTLLLSSVYILYISLFWPTPDLLFCLFLLLYCQSVWSKQFDVKSSFLSGVFGGLAYLSKAFGLPFFLIHFTITNFVFGIQKPQQKHRVFRSYLIGLVTFLFIVGTWCSILTLKYDKFTFGTAGSFNLSLVGNNFKYSPMGLRIKDSGDILTPPPTPNAINTWEDPSVWNIRKKVPWESKETGLVFLRHIPSNVKNQLLILLSVWGPFTLLSLPAFILALKNRKSLDSQSTLFWILSGALYLIGYWLIYQKERYLWFPMFALFPVVFILKKSIWKLLPSKPFQLIFNFCFLFLLVFIVTIPAAKGLWNHRHSGLKEAQVAEKLKPQVGSHPRIVSGPHYGEVDLTHILSLLNGHFYGNVKNHVLRNNFDQLIEELKSQKVDFFLSWDEYTNNLLKNVDSSRMHRSEFPHVYDVKQMVREYENQKDLVEDL